MNNNGDYTLKSTVNDNYEKVYQSVSYDKESGDIIVKMINPYTTEKKSNIVIDSGFTLTGKADVEMLKGDSLTRGIKVEIDSDNRIEVDFHVIVSYGVSISTVADNLIENVKYKVSEFTGLEIKKINIYVEGVRVID